MGEHLDYDSLRADTVFLAGKHLFIETVIVDDRDTLARLAAWMRARGKERREPTWRGVRRTAHVRARRGP